MFVVTNDFKTSELRIYYFYSAVETGESVFRHTIYDKLVQSHNHYVLFSHPVLYKTILHWTGHSDHYVVLLVLEIPNQQPQATHIRFPSSTGILELCMLAE
jgi:hypothetical protein